MENNDKIYTEGIKPKSDFYKWLDNYWYHYKWITIGVVFLLVVLVVCTLQMCEKEKEDTTILYAGPCQLSAEEAENIKAVFNAVMPEDYDGDGKKNTAMIYYQIYSEEQIKEVEASTDELGISIEVNRNYITQNQDNYYQYLLTGETSICLVDPNLYYVLVRENRLAPVVTALGTDSGYEDDDYGIILGKTEIYEAYSALRVLPEDTVICILRANFVGRTSDEEVYKNDLEIFEAVVEYKKQD